MVGVDAITMNLHTKCSRRSNNQGIYIETCVEYGYIVGVSPLFTQLPCLCSHNSSPHTRGLLPHTRGLVLPHKRGLFLPHKRGLSLPHKRGFLPHKRGLSSSQERTEALLEGVTFSSSLSLAHATPIVGLAHKLTLRTCRRVSPPECVSCH